MKGALLSSPKLPQRLLTHSLGTGPSAARENSVRREFQPMAASNRSRPAVGVSRIAARAVAQAVELPPVPRELRPVRRKQRRAVSAVRAWAGR